jgi:low affinity Fe/Cu permease
MSAGLFDKFSNTVSHGAGKAGTFVAAVALIAGWAITGPFFGFSETWQLVVNTGTTIVTFLMVFVLQHSQNRDGEAVQAKLDDLILAVRKADNRLIGAEELDIHELHRLRKLISEQVESGTAKLAEIEDRIEDETKETGRKTAEKA